MPIRPYLAAVLLLAATIAARAQNVGINTTAPTSTLQVNGTLAVGVAQGVVGNSNGGTQLGSYNASYLGLTPSAGGSDYYQLPSAPASSGRIYYLRNNNAQNGDNAYIGVVANGGSIYLATDTQPLLDSNGYNTLVMQPTGNSKTVTLVSDGSNWIVLKPGS